MKYPVEFTVHYTLDAQPSHLVARWEDPDGVFHSFHEALPEGCTEREVAACIQMVREAVTADPW